MNTENRSDTTMSDPSKFMRGSLARMAIWMDMTCCPITLGGVEWAWGEVEEWCEIGSVAK